MCLGRVDSMEAQSSSAHIISSSRSSMGILNFFVVLSIFYSVQFDISVDHDCDIRTVHPFCNSEQRPDPENSHIHIGLFRLYATITTRTTSNLMGLPVLLR